MTLRREELPLYSVNKFLKGQSRGEAATGYSNIRNSFPPP